MSPVSFVVGSIRRSSLYRSSPPLVFLRRHAAAARTVLKDRVRTLVAPSRRELDHQHMAMLFSWVLEADACCVDVGAHSGEVLDLFLALAPRGQHVAFEPLPQFQSLLRQNYPQVKLYDVALGSQDGSVEFTEVVDAPALSGLASAGMSGQHEVRRHQVRVRRLDDVLGPEARPDFIKIDVEGAELGVLQGAVETLRRCRPVLLFEHQKTSPIRTGADTYGTGPADVHRLLVDELGYRIFDIDGRGPLSVAEMQRLFDGEISRNFVAHP